MLCLPRSRRSGSHATRNTQWNGRRHGLPWNSVRAGFCNLARVLSQQHSCAIQQQMAYQYLGKTTNSLSESLVDGTRSGALAGARRLHLRFTPQWCHEAATGTHRKRFPTSSQETKSGETGTYFWALFSSCLVKQCLVRFAFFDSCTQRHQHI